MRTVVSLARRAVVFEIALYRSLFRWVTRRPDVAPGGVAFRYVGAVALLLWVFIGVSAVELVVVHVLLPWETVRLVADIIGIWGLIWMLGLAASYSVHPHVVTESGLRIRQGHGVDITVPWEDVASVGMRERSRDTSKALQVDRSEQAVVLNVVMGSMTDVDIRLKRPLLVPVRGSEESVTEIRLYADEPRLLVAAAREHLAPAAQPKRSST